jgi:hypothetical protein
MTIHNASTEIDQQDARTIPTPKLSAIQTIA